MKTLSTCLAMTLGVLSFALSNTSFAEMSTLDVAQATIGGLMTESCSHYKITGVCIWKKDLISPPTVTFKIDQYEPDAVVSVFSKPTNNPWDYAQTIIDPLAYDTGKTLYRDKTGFALEYGDEHTRSPRDIDTRLFEADVIGNPALILLKHLGVVLPSAAHPFKLYYSSLLDAYSWRSALVEGLFPGSLVPGLHDVGEIIVNDWGPVYPRTGFIAQPDFYKAAAVIAQRASDIITQDGQPHLYQRLPNVCGKTHCDAEPVAENNKQT